MTNKNQIEQRLTAVEQTVSSGTYDTDTRSELVDAIERLDELESRMERIESRLATIEGKTEWAESYMWNIESANEDLKEQANVAVASVDRLERRLVEIEQLTDHSTVEQLTDRVETLEEEIQNLSQQYLETTPDDEFESSVYGDVDDEPSIQRANAKREKKEQVGKKADAVEKN